MGRSKPDPSFRQPRRREVDGEPAERPLELRARDAAPDPLLRFLASLVRESDDRERRDPALEMRLDFNGPGLEPDESMGGGARKHTSEGMSQKRAEPAPAGPKPARTGDKCHLEEYRRNLPS